MIGVRLGVGGSNYVHDGVLGGRGGFFVCLVILLERRIGVKIL